MKKPKFKNKTAKKYYDELVMQVSKSKKDIAEGKSKKYKVKNGKLVEIKN